VGDVLSCYLGSQVAGVLAVSVAAGFGATDKSIAFVVAGLLGTWVGFVGGPWALRQRRGSGDLRRDFGIRISGWRDVALGLAAGVGTFVIVLVVLYPPLLWLLRHLSGQHVQVGGTAQALGKLGRGPGFVVFALSVAVGAPIAEEIFFRGLVLVALRRRVGRAWAILGCGLLFGLAHALGTEAAAIPALVIFGVVLSVLADRTGRLGPGMVAHMAFNGITVVQLALHR
jgi:membrane protease YdiL (CAAX protease family)